MVGDPSNITLRMPPEELACISQEKEWRNYSRKRQRVMKEFPPKKNQACNASHFQKLRFVRFPAFGTISGNHLECVQRFLFLLFHSNFLVQSLSNSIFWLKESDFGLDKWFQACFWKKLPPKRNPASSSKASFWEGFWEESYTKRAGQQTLMHNQSETSRFSKFA